MRRTSPKVARRFVQPVAALSTTGNRAESRKCLQILLNADQNNIYYLVAALEEHTEDRNFEAGEAFARKLLAEHAGEFRAVAAVGRFECQAGRPLEAGRSPSYAQSANPSAGDHLTRSARVAELLDELSRQPRVKGTPAARAMKTALSNVSPHSSPRIPMAGPSALAADGRTNEAFARLERLGSFVPVRLRVAAGLAIVRAGTVSEQQAGLVRGWIENCLAEEPLSPVLMLNRAEFFSALRQETAAGDCPV